MYSHETGDMPALRPLFIAHLEQGWRLASSGRAQCGDEELDLAGLLPAGTRVEYMVPQLQEGPPEDDAAENLARYLHIVLPAGEAPEPYVNELRKLPCFDEVRLPPEISLPRGTA